MKLMTGCLVLAIMAVAAGPADAVSWPWNWKLSRGTSGRNPRLPKPIDSPIVRPRLEAEKATRQKHPSRFTDTTWGQDKRNRQTLHPHEGNHSLFVD